MLQKRVHNNRCFHMIFLNHDFEDGKILFLDIHAEIQSTFEKSEHYYNSIITLKLGRNTHFQCRTT